MATSASCLAVRNLPAAYLDAGTILRRVSTPEKLETPPPHFLHAHFAWAKSKRELREQHSLGGPEA